LIKRLYNKLFITGKTKIRHLITRISDGKKVDSEKVNGEKVDGEKVDGEKVDSEKVNSNKVDNNRVNGKELKRVNIIFDYSLLII
jgi:uncharacterized transporter YbjL